MKKYIIVVLLVFAFSQVEAQDGPIKDRLNFKIGYQTFNNSNVKSWRTYMPSFSANYGFAKHLECGLSSWYTASYYTGHFSNQSINNVANCNFHILPFFIDSDNFRFDLYVNANIGACTVLKADYYPVSFTKLIYGVGVGFAFYPLQHIGMFVEYNYGEYWFINHSVKYGVTLKF